MYFIKFLIIIIVVLARYYVVEASNDSTFPMLFVALDETENEEYTLPVMTRESSILWPKARSLRLKCVSDYAIYWDSSVAIVKYEIPFWYSNDFSENADPTLQDQGSKYLMEATFHITQTTVGYISCASIREPLLRSRISVYGKGGRNYINGKYPRTGKYEVKEVLDSCGTEYVLYSNRDSSESSSLEILQNNTWFTEFPQLGLFFYSPVLDHTDEIVKCVQLELKDVHLEIFKNASIPGKNQHIPLNTTLATQVNCGRVSNSCEFYPCTNPFECDIVMGTREVINCADFNNKSLVGMRLNGCRGSYKIREYIFNGPDKSPYWFPMDFPKRSLVQMTTPKNQIFVLNGFSTIICSASVFLLSRHLIFALQYQNATLKYLRDSEENRMIEDGMVQRNLTIYVEETLESVVCMTQWYSFDRWATQSIPIEPKINRFPSIKILVYKDGVESNEIENNINETTAYKLRRPFEVTSVVCFATGFPSPNVTWVDKPPTGVLVYTEQNLTHRWITIKFPGEHMDVTGTYTCKAINIHGDISATVKLLIEDADLYVPSVIAIVVCSTIVVILAVGLAIVWIRTHIKARN